MEDTLSLRDIFNTIRKRLGLIILLTILGVAIAGILSFMVLKPVYESSAELLVNHSSSETGQLTDDSIRTNLQLINTYSGIIKSPVILNQVVERLNLNLTTEQLNEKITVSNVEESQIVTIIVRDGDPAMAVEIVNTTASIFENEIPELMNVDNVRILSPAVLAEDPVPASPIPGLNMAIAAAVGLLLGVGIAFLLENMDTTLKDQQDIEEVLGIPFLGFVSPIAEKAELAAHSKVVQSKPAVEERTV